MFWFLAEAAFLILLTVIIVCINSIMSKCDFVKIWKLKYLFFVGLIQFWHFLQRFRSVIMLFVIVFHLLNCVQLFEIPWIAVRQAPLAFTKPQFTQIHVHCISDVIQPSHPLPPTSPLAIHLSQQQELLQWVGLHITWPKYWSFSFIISFSNEYSGLISFSIDWVGLLTVQGTFHSFSPVPQFESINSSVGCIFVSKNDFLRDHLSCIQPLKISPCLFIALVINSAFDPREPWVSLPAHTQFFHWFWPTFPLGCHVLTRCVPVP